MAARLVEWHSLVSAPRLPCPDANDPYEVLVAVLMLARTTREQVARVFPEFIARYPSPVALAEAKPRELKRLLRPLGLANNRTSTLLAVGRALSHASSFPSTLTDLLELPGVGEYGASTVLCTSFGQQVPMVDVNSTRVVRRVFGDAVAIEDFFHTADADLRRLNVALLDFAHYICRARNPLCESCVIKAHCQFYAGKSKKQGGFLRSSGRSRLRP